MKKSYTVQTKSKSFSWLASNTVKKTVYIVLLRFRFLYSNLFWIYIVKTSKFPRFGIKFFFLIKNLLPSTLSRKVTRLLNGTKKNWVAIGKFCYFSTTKREIYLHNCAMRNSYYAFQIKYILIYCKNRTSFM